MKRRTQRIPRNVFKKKSEKKQKVHGARKMQQEGAQEKRKTLSPQSRRPTRPSFPLGGGRGQGEKWGDDK